MAWTEISRAWAERTRALCVERFGHGPDLVFSSEDYGPCYAGHLGARHLAVDPQRVRVPISGTAVRADPFGAWQYLHPCVRAWYVRRICVLGAESTGTTTLARDLAERLGCPWVPGYGRAYCEQLAARTGSIEIDWGSNDFVHIAGRQLVDEDVAARSGAHLIVCDTDALATSVWHERYLGTRNAEVERLAARPEPWLEVQGSPQQRLEAALAAVRPLLPEGWRSGERPTADQTVRAAGTGDPVAAKRIRGGGRGGGTGLVRSRRYPDQAAWRAALRLSDVRVQWDPDHDPHGRPLPRRAIQLGLRGGTLRRYAHSGPGHDGGISTGSRQPTLCGQSPRPRPGCIEPLEIWQPRDTTRRPRTALSSPGPTQRRSGC